MKNRIVRRSDTTESLGPLVSNIKLYCWGGIVFIAFILLSGCMIEPHNHQEVAQKTDEVLFTGGVANSFAEVTIEVYNSQTKQWEQLSKTTSSDMKVDAGGVEMYVWSERIAIPNKYWMKDCASTGHHAQVRSSWGLGDLITVEDGWRDCWLQSEDFADFYFNCRSPESSVANVDTANYRDFGKECVERINKLRALEGLPPLQRYKGKECAADGDAKKNYEANKPHLSQSGDGQNECSTRSSVDDVLNGCIEQGMYYGEKPCYQQHGSSCFYGDTTPCVCGHYINITDTQYKKVACGLYVTPSGQYKSVQNFYR